MAFESCGTGKPYGPVFATGQCTCCVGDNGNPFCDAIMCICCAVQVMFMLVCPVIGATQVLLNIHAGDIVGALLNRATKTISFTKNGLDLGVAFTNVNEDLLYPSVGLRTPEEEVRQKCLLLCHVSLLPNTCILCAQLRDHICCVNLAQDMPSGVLLRVCPCV